MPLCCSALTTLTGPTALMQFDTLRIVRGPTPSVFRPTPSPSSRSHSLKACGVEQLAAGGPPLGALGHSCPQQLIVPAAEQGIPNSTRRPTSGPSIYSKAVQHKQTDRHWRALHCSVQYHKVMKSFRSSIDDFRLSIIVVYIQLITSCHYGAGLRSLLRQHLWLPPAHQH